MFSHDRSDFVLSDINQLKVEMINTHLDNLVSGTDDQGALDKATAITQPESSNVLCTQHLKTNRKID